MDIRTVDERIKAGLVCTCSEGFLTPGCPVHCNITGESFANDIEVVTDENLTGFTPGPG